MAVPAEATELLVLSQLTQEVLEYDGLRGSFQGVFARTIQDGFRIPGDIAVRPSNGVLYVSSISTGEIWSYDSNGDPILPAVAGGLFAPFGIDFDAGGSHLYFVDASTVDSEFSDAVKQLDVASGVVTILGTNNQADLLGVAVNGGDVFATDVALDRILRFPVSGGPEAVAVSTGLSQPGTLLFPTATQMLVADSGNDRVVEYLETGGSWSFQREVLPASAGVQDPSGLALAPDGRLTVSGRQSGNVVLVDLVTEVVTPLLGPGAGGLSDPKGLAWNGNVLHVASPSGNAVFYFAASGQSTGVRADGRSASLDAGIALSPDGSRLFVGSISGNDVIEFDVASGARVHIYSQACPNLPLPFDVAIGPGNRLYVSCTLNHSVEHFDTTTGTALGSFVIAGFGGLQSPRGLAFGPSGNLFVSSGTGEILEFDASTGAAVGPPSFVDAGGNGGGAIDPYGLRFHAGVLYVASFSFDEVKAFDATTGAFLSSFVPSGLGGLTGPTAVDFGPFGDLYVTSQGDHAVRRYDGGTGDFVEVFVPSGSGGLDTPFDLVFRIGDAQQLPALSHPARLLLLAAISAAAVHRIRRSSRKSPRSPRSSESRKRCREDET